MDQQKKQKIMIAVLAVLIVGAGSTYWFGFRDSGTQASQQTVRKSQGRKTREGYKKASDKKNKRKQRVVARDEFKPTSERKTRERRTTTFKGRRSRRGSAREEKKKKKTPAA